MLYTFGENDIAPAICAAPRIDWLTAGLDPAYVWEGEGEWR